MRRLILVVWFFCTLSVAAAQESLVPPRDVQVQPVSGPWVLLHADGRVRIGVEFSATLAPERLAHIHLRTAETSGDSAARPTVVAAERRVQRIQRPYSKPSQLLTLLLERDQALHQTVDLWLGPGRVRSLRLPHLPHPESSVRMMFIGGSQWPRASQVAAVEEALEGSLDAAVVLGDQWLHHLGSGGWEHNLPLIVPQTGAAEDELQRQFLGQGADWQGGIDLGPLGLPLLGKSAEAALDIAAFSQAWLVPVDMAGLWRLDRRGAAEAASPAGIALMVDAAHRRGQLPLILSGQGQAGFISDPLVAEDARRLRAATGGVRYMSALMSGDSLRSIPPEVALPIDQPALLALRANPQLLQLRVHPLQDDGQPIQLQWNQPRSHERDGPSAAWGKGSAEQLWAAWQESADPQLLHELAWLPLPELIELGFSSEHLRAILQSPETAAAWLLRRTTAADVGLINEWISSQGSAAPVVQRDVILRQLHDPRRWPQTSFTRLLAESEDAQVIHSVLRVAEQQRSPQLLQVMVRRVQAQVAGEVAWDSDPMLQYAISHGLFDSPYLSPTPLRPLAGPLRQRYAPLAHAPIERFIDRYGEERNDRR